MKKYEVTTGTSRIEAEHFTEIMAQWQEHEKSGQALKMRKFHSINLRKPLKSSQFVEAKFTTADEETYVLEYGYGEWCLSVYDKETKELEYLDSFQYNGAFHVVRHQNKLFMTYITDLSSESQPCIHVAVYESYDPEKADKNTFFCKSTFYGELKDHLNKTKIRLNMKKSTPDYHSLINRVNLDGKRILLDIDGLPFELYFNSFNAVLTDVNRDEMWSERPDICYVGVDDKFHVLTECRFSNPANGATLHIHLYHQPEPFSDRVTMCELSFPLANILDQNRICTVAQVYGLINQNPS